MKNKHLVELDFEGMMQDIRNKKTNPLEVAEFIVKAMNVDCDFENEYPFLKLMRDVQLATGTINQENGMFYVDREAHYYKPIAPDDLKDVKGFKVCESREEWEEFKEDQQKKTKRRKVEQKLKERRQARRRG